MAGKRSIRHPKSAIPHLETYWERTQYPLQCLYFLLPILVLYEVGSIYVTRGSSRLVAERLLGMFFEWFGVASYYLPAVIVVVVLLCWHIARRDSWRPQPKLYALMWVESIILALPLFVFVLVLFRELPGAWQVDPNVAVPLTGPAPKPPWQHELVFSVGAGIYEELLFRLIAIALLHMLLVDVLALPDMWGAAGAVFGSALAFALYHFPPFWDTRAFTDAFSPGQFAFYTFAGLYLAAVYVLRGFGIVAATHALYDVLVVVTPLVGAGRG